MPLNADPIETSETWSLPGEQTVLHSRIRSLTQVGSLFDATQSTNNLCSAFVVVINTCVADIILDTYLLKWLSSQTPDVYISQSVTILSVCSPCSVA